MLAGIEASPESVTNLMLKTFEGAHSMNADLQSAEQALSMARHDLGRYTADAYLHGESRFLTFQREAMRRQRLIRRGEEVTDILRAGLEQYLSDTVEEVDNTIAHLLHGMTIEARILAGMQPTNPIDIKSRKRVRPYKGAGETVRGTFAGVSSMDGTLELHHPIQGVTLGVQVIRMHRGTIRPAVGLEFHAPYSHSMVSRPRAG